MSDEELREKIKVIADMTLASGGSMNDLVFELNKYPEFIALIHKDNRADTQATRH